MPGPRKHAPAPADPPSLPAHLVPLVAQRWAVWRWVCLRGAGFPFARLAALASPALAAAADELLDAVALDAVPPGTASAAARASYEAEFTRAERQLSRGLHATATDPRFREAVAWQNRRALEAGIGALLRRDPETVVRNARHRKNEALVASYLQRYCAKNDTIGFFGPAGWAHIGDSGPAVRLRVAPDGEPAQRTVYFEGWAVRALAEAYAAQVRPWLVPRRTPLLDVVLGVDGSDSWLRVPFASPTRISRLTAYTLSLVDGARTGREIAAAVLAEPAVAARDEAGVLALLAELHEQRRIVWTLDVAPDDIRPERTMRARLETVSDPARRAPALAALAELESARDAVAAAARGPGDRPGAVVSALSGLDAAFTRLTGAEPRRRAGETYAGRTLAYEECLRADEVTFGASLLDPVRDALGLVLDAARWFTAAGGALVHRMCLEVYQARVRETGSAVVPFAEFWLRAHELIFDMPPSLVASLVRALQERWARILALPPGARRVILRSAELMDPVRSTFAVARPGWAAAVHHSPDLLLGATGVDAVLAGDVRWVLGELHPGTNTLRYATRVAYHPDPEALRRAVAADLGRPQVRLAPSGERGAMPARAANGLVGPDDVWMVFAHDSNGYDPARTLLVGECELVESAGRLVVRDRSGRRELDLVEVLADMVSMQLVQHFRIVPPAAHTPRVSIDRLVVHREAWSFRAMELSFVDTVAEAGRFLAVRRWARAHGLPRHLFVRFAGERKPIFVDLASLASVDMLARGVRQARAHADGQVTVAEMLPTPDQLWLADAQDRRYTCELRVCATDRTAP